MLLVIAMSKATTQSIGSHRKSGLLRAACHRAALCADLARNDVEEKRRSVSALSF